MREREALKKVLELSKHGNQFFQEKEPWKKIKEEKQAADDAVYSLLQLIKDLAILTEPLLPATAANLFKQLGMEKVGWKELGKESLKAGHPIGKAEVLFKKLEKAQAGEFREKYSGRK